MMITVQSFTGSKTSFTAPAVLVGDANLPLVATARRVYLANLRQGTAKTKSRSEINRTTKKMYKQKGTGGARHASRRAPIFVGGGVTFGPRGNQNWTLHLSKQQKTAALLESLKAQREHIVVLADLAATKGKTKVANAQLKTIAQSGTCLVIYEGSQAQDVKSLQNIKYVIMCRVDQVTALDIVSVDTVLITKEAWEPLVKRLGADVQGRIKKSSQPAPAADDTQSAKKVEKVVVAEKSAKPVKKPVQKKAPAKKVATSSAKKSDKKA